MENILNDLKSEVKQWWVSMLVGIAYVIAAVTIMCLPLSAYAALSIIFSVCVLTGGILEVIFAASNHKTMDTWIWYLIGGVIDIIIGIVLCVSPAITMELLPVLLSFWFIFKGFNLMGYALDLKKFHSKNWGWSFLFSILIIIFAILILFRPVSGAIYIVYTLSFIFLIIGMFKITLSLDLRSLYKKYKNHTKQNNN